MILIELQKVFDSIDYQIVLQKVKNLDFQNIQIDSLNSEHGAAWFKCNLNEQKFKINISTSCSRSLGLICGFLQGSILE